MVLLQLADEFPSSVVKPIITVHDSILAEVRDHHVERVVHRIEEIMRGPALLKTFGIQFSVPLAGEVKIGPWGSGIGLEKWKQLHG
jgi:DNA polymerase I-like protein with 3'-5' exonuclease and polymerase domains